LLRGRGRSSGCTICPCVARAPRGLLRDSPERDYWQAGKSVARIDRIEPAAGIVRRFAAAWRDAAAA
jgi:hypothetical protein